MSPCVLTSHASEPSFYSYYVHKFRLFYLIGTQTSLSEHHVSLKTQSTKAFQNPEKNTQIPSREIIAKACLDTATLRRYCVYRLGRLAKAVAQITNVLRYVLHPSKRTVEFDESNSQYNCNPNNSLCDVAVDAPLKITLWQYVLTGMGIAISKSSFCVTPCNNT
jgi:hypothetical protein